MRLLTRFDAQEIHAYRKAVRKWPGGDQFVVSGPDPARDIGRADGALHYKGSDFDLSPFWRHLDVYRQELRGLRAAGASENMLLRWSAN